ncbi:MAG: hypothetical protein DHS20C21_03450 [Gemmatimonadota bacterium]|nr:MAG: hypothetical protein DHS20C21_03450 [Gemmatimonadota bacterium]
MRIATLVLVFGTALVDPVCSAEFCPVYGWGLDCYYSTTGYSIGYNTDSTVALCAQDTTVCIRSSPYKHVVSISASDADPQVNRGPLEPGQDLFVWLLCTERSYGISYGFVYSQYAVETDMDVHDYVPIVGTGEWIADPDPFPKSLLTIRVTEGGCVFPTPLLMGRLRIGNPTSNEIVPWGRIKALYR